MDDGGDEIMEASQVDEIVKAFDDSEALKLSKKDYSGDTFVKGIKKMKALKFKSADKQIEWIGDNIAVKLQNELQKLLEHKDRLAEVSTNMEASLKQAVASAKLHAKKASHDNGRLRQANEEITGRLEKATEDASEKEGAIARIKEDIQVHTEEIEFLKATNVDLSHNLREVSAKLSCTEKLLGQSQSALATATTELAKARSVLEETKAEKEAMLSSRDESFREEMEKLKADHEMEVQGLQTSFEQQLSTEKHSNTEGLDALRAQSMLSLETAKKAHEVSIYLRLTCIQGSVGFSYLPVLGLVRVS